MLMGRKRIAFGEGNVALYATPNSFHCSLYLNEICLNQKDRQGNKNKTGPSTQNYIPKRGQYSQNIV